MLILAVVFGLFMAWGIGANDVANAMAPSVGAGALTVGGAILIAGVFEFLGAFLAGGEVTATIRKGIIDAELLADDPNTLVYGMLASLLAAGVWLTIASRYGWPVSTTHSIVGAIVGFAWVAGNKCACSDEQMDACEQHLRREDREKRHARCESPDVRSRCELNPHYILRILAIWRWCPRRWANNENWFKPICG